VFSNYFAAPVEVECMDLSAQGMYLAVDLLLPPGERVLVAFIPPGTWHRILVDAEVRHARQGMECGMGLHFDRLPRMDESVLRTALAGYAGDRGFLVRDGACRC
jgi:hypothetical protein